MSAKSLGIVVLLVAGAIACEPPARGTVPVLILGGTVSGGSPGRELQAAAGLELDVHVVTPEQWRAMTAEQFSRYRALIIGDAACQRGEEAFQAAIDTRDIWGPSVDGNVVLESGETNSGLSVRESLARVSGTPHRTGIYIAQECTDVLGMLGALPGGRSAVARLGTWAECISETYAVEATTSCGVAVSIAKYPDADSNCIQDPPTTQELVKSQLVTLWCQDPGTGEESYCETYVIVTDATVPNINLIGSADQRVECGGTYTDPGATARDPCEGDLKQRIVTSGDVVNPAVRGTYQITYSVDDGNGHSAPSRSRTVTVQDTTAPSINCPAPIEQKAESDGSATITWPQVSGTDTCSKNVTVSPPTQTRFSVGTTSVTYTARDEAGHETSCSVSVTVNPASDRAMLGAGCSATAETASVPVALMGLVALGFRLVARPQRQLQRGRAARRSSRLGCWIILGVLGLGARASAQTSSIPVFELERLRLNPSGMGSWVMGTGELLPAGGYRVALAGHYENKPLTLYEDGTPLGVIVRHRATALLSAAVGIGDWVEVGAQVPLLLLQQGDDLTGHDVTAPQGGVAPGTPLLTIRARLLAEQQKDPVDLAVGMSAGPPLGSGAALARELHAIPNVMVGRRFGSLRTSLDAGLMLRPSTILTQDANIQDELGHALRVGVGMSSTAEGLGGEVAAIGSVPLRREGYSLELLGGVRLPLGRLVEAHGLAGFGMGDAPGTPRFRLLLGLSMGKVSRPPVAEASEDTPAPREIEDPDRDRDGVLNRVDDCPDKPGPASHRGCPLVDTDEDGLVDERDQCPKKAGIVEMRGCPLKDTDGDTVWDHIDNCREVPGPPENQGCPSKNRQLVIIQRNRIAIQDTIHFDYDKDTIKSVSFPLLDQVARVLVEHPEIILVSIEGHTDAMGTDAYNHDLARRRANSVRDYLQGKGVARSRMRIRSFGEDRPRQTNVTEKGRAINRRVEFITWYETDAP